MANIDVRFGAGGKNIQPGGSNGSPSLAKALRDIADDLAGIQGAAVGAMTASAAGALTASAAGALTASAAGALTASAIATADANVQSGSYVQADAQSVAALANATKTKVNAAIVDLAALRTVINAEVVDLAALRTAVNAAIVDLGAIRTVVNALVVDVGAIRTGVNNAQGYTLKTIKV